MNGTDNLVRQALQSLDRDVRISESDVASAYARFLHRSGQQVHPRRRIALVAVAAGVVGAVAGGLVVRSLDEPAVTPVSPADTGPADPADIVPLDAPTSEDLVGLWVLPDSGGWAWEFRSDGSLSVLSPQQRRDPEGGYYQVVDGVLDAGQICRFRLRQEGADTIVGISTNDDGEHGGCPWPVGDSQTWLRVSPAATTSGPALGALGVTDQLPPSEFSLPGVWWKEETGQVLVLSEAPQGLTYRLDDDGDVVADPDDTGTAVLDARGVLTLTSGSAGEDLPPSDSCEAGDSARLSQVRVGTYESRLLPAPVRVMTARSDAGGCPAHDGLDGTWVDVP